MQILCFIAPLLKKRKKKYDLILFPYSQKGSDGYLRRFEEYYPHLNKDGMSFKAQDICLDKEYKEAVKGRKSRYYLFLLKVFRIRIKQVIDLRYAKKAFVHRSLFPFYFDQKKPFLEKLASKLCAEVVYDYWDSVWVHNEELNNRIVETADTISVANDFLYEYYSSLHKNVKYFNIGINLSHYLPKKDYDKRENELRLFYTGSPGNVKQMLHVIGEYLVEFSKRVNLTLVLVSSEPKVYDGLNIEHHYFENATFFKLLQTSDIGIYALDDTISTRGKMAMKVLDYSATALPILATRYGVSPHLIDNENVLFCDTKSDWLNNLELCNSSKELREKLGKNSRKMVEEFHTINSSYIEFKSLFKSL